MQVDYLIVGQGLCGSWLSYCLLQDGASVLVVDPGSPWSASGIASGVINPITGKRLARQWMADTILPFVKGAYEQLGKHLHQEIVATLPIHTFFSTSEEAAFFGQKAETTHEDVLSYDVTVTDSEHFNYHYGLGTVFPAMLVNVGAFLNTWRAHLASQSALQQESFDWSRPVVRDDNVRYGGISAKAVIDCTGACSAHNPYFNRLPFALNKGEAIIASIPGLSPQAIYRHADLSIVPWVDNNFWIGSTFDWDFTDELPTADFRSKAENILRQWLRLPFIFQEHYAAIRPATVTRDAFSGLHPHFPQVGILNGTGSKGCSLAPFLAHNLARHLLKGEPLIAQVDIKRYARALSR